MFGPGQSLLRAARWWLASALVIVAILALPFAAAADDRTNLPLKNWGGFSLYRDAVYDDLERLVTAGLADRTLLNTKPLSRVEAARIVARAIDRIRRDETGGLNTRRDLEPVLDRLMEEFKVELAGLGVRLPDSPTPPGVFSFTPVDRAQVYAGYANHLLSLVNEQGHSFKRGANGGLTFESRLQIGDFLTLYVQPELLANEDYTAVRLATGYVKLTFWNIELLFGRDSLAWGPGYHNGPLLSDNAAPLDQIRLGSAEPFLLPWIGQWVGPMKALIFLAQLEERRDHPHAKLAGMRLTVSPASFLELGASRAVMFDGCCPYLALSKYPSAIFVSSFGNDSNHPEQRTNNLFSVDGELRFRAAISGSTASSTGTTPAASAVRAPASATSWPRIFCRREARSAASEACTFSGSSGKTGWTPGSSMGGRLPSRSFTAISPAATGRAATSSRISSARTAAISSPASPLG